MTPGVPAAGTRETFSRPAGGVPADVSSESPTAGSPAAGFPAESPAATEAAEPDAPEGGPPEEEPRRRDPLWARLLIVFGALLMLVRA